MSSCMVATPEARSREQGGERDDHGVTEPDGSGGRIDMAGAAVVPKAGTELAEPRNTDTSFEQLELELEKRIWFVSGARL